MKWTAFLRLEGETWTKKSEEMLDEFSGLVQFLRGVDVDYNLIVFVENKGRRIFRLHKSEQDPEIWTHREKSGT